MIDHSDGGGFIDAIYLPATRTGAGRRGRPPDPCAAGHAPRRAGSMGRRHPRKLPPMSAHTRRASSPQPERTVEPANERRQRLEVARQGRRQPGRECLPLGERTADGEGLDSGATAPRDAPRRSRGAAGSAFPRRRGRRSVDGSRARARFARTLRRRDSSPSRSFASEVAAASRCRRRCGTAPARGGSRIRLPPPPRRRLPGPRRCGRTSSPRASCTATCPAKSGRPGESGTSSAGDRR